MTIICARDAQSIWTHIRIVLVHMRLVIQMLLAPVFLWGWLLSPSSMTPRFVIAFVSFHLFGYTGATLFNSFYDRDEGPVGGIERPPPVSPSMLPISLLLLSTGFVLACLVSPAFLVIYACLAVLAIAYSHPSVRLKRRPFLSTFVVGIGQGLLVYSAGWVTTGTGWTEIDVQKAFAGMWPPALLIMGGYLFSQIYQAREDRARGDQTLTVRLGPRRTICIAVACHVIGGFILVIEFGAWFGPLQAAFLFAGVTVLAVKMILWVRHFDSSDVLRNYRVVMRASTLGSISVGAIELYEVFATKLLL